MTDCETIVVGAGVVGLAVGRAMALRGQEVVVLERERLIGSETSSRNSEVIHAGIYYTPGSLKARLCVEGREMLYRYCASNGIPYRRIGKLIVATADNQIHTLKTIRGTAEANGVVDLQLVGRDSALAMEPNLACVAALHSPSTGIIHGHAYMQALEGEIGAHRGQVVLGTDVVGIEAVSGGFALSLGGDQGKVTTRNLVLAAGLHGTRLMAGLENESYKAPRTLFAKGNYFSLNRRAPFSRLIYPVPESGGLGVHLTLDLQGRARFGPDVEWVDEIGYGVDPDRSQVFYAAIRTYWPDLPDDSLSADYCGIRPKLAGPGAPNADFTIHGPMDHGHDGLVALYGIESPGLTASPAIAEAVADMIDMSVALH